MSVSLNHIFCPTDLVNCYCAATYYLFVYIYFKLRKITYIR
jgi:hypothetical protein